MSYRFNILGDRCAEFDDTAEIRLLAIGCSYVLGLGVAQDHLFHERFAARLRADLGRSVVVWNLGVAGASNECITRLLHLAIPRLDPHLVLINFTHNGRREYVTVQNRYWNFVVPAWRPPDEIHGITAHEIEIIQEISSHFTALISPYNDQLNFFRNYKAVELILGNRLWLYSHINPAEFEPIVAHMDLGRFVGPLRFDDKARDHWHPGPQSHEILAGLYWDRFLAIGGLDAMAKVARPLQERRAGSSVEVDPLR